MRMAFLALLLALLPDRNKVLNLLGTRLAFYYYEWHLETERAVAKWHYGELRRLDGNFAQREHAHEITKAVVRAHGFKNC